MTDVVFHRDHARLGRFELRPVVPAEDALGLHTWVTDPKSLFWLMQDADVADVEREYAHP